MIDIQTEHLLAAIRDALAVPYPATDAARPAYLELHRDRGAAVRSVLTHALATGDLAAATDRVDEAIVSLSVTYPAEARWTPDGMEVSR